jgi:hypothetical protein
MEEGGMPYAVVINLDYENHPSALCAEFWNLIKLGMFQAGFRAEGRTFTIDLPESRACALASQVIERIEADLGYHPGHLHRFLKAFYGYDTACTTNLLGELAAPMLLSESTA